MSLCPQEYSPQMKVVKCTRCTGWNGNICMIATGTEQLFGAELIPSCPIQESCQHSIQTDYLCSVRKAGYICELALAYVGIENTSEHPLAFNADWLFNALHEQENDWLNSVNLQKSQAYLLRSRDLLKLKQAIAYEQL